MGSLFVFVVFATLSLVVVDSCPFAKFSTILGEMLLSNILGEFSFSQLGMSSARNLLMLGDQPPTAQPMAKSAATFNMRRNPTNPTAPPTLKPSGTGRPLASPTLRPTTTPQPTAVPSFKPSSLPIATPTKNPTPSPSFSPSSLPTLSPTLPISGYLPGPQCKAGSLQPQSLASMCTLTTSIKSDFSNLIAGYNTAQRAQLFGASIRLSFHDAGEIALQNLTDRLGPDGCLSISSDNFGLIQAQEEVYSIIEPIWQKYCQQISRADFWAYWGKLVAETAATAPISIVYHYGRVDNSECNGGAGRLPSAFMVDVDAVKSTFVTNLGLTLTDAVVLLGGHSLGHVSTNFSGFGFNPVGSNVDSNSWDTTPDKLDNNYYSQMVGIPWALAPAVTAPFHKQDYVRGNGDNIMLNVDMSLAFIIDTNSDGVADAAACGGGRNRCASSSVLTFVNALAANNTLFVESFALSYTKMVNVGYSYSSSSPSTASGKLGSLTTLQC